MTEKHRDGVCPVCGAPVTRIPSTYRYCDNVLTLHWECTRCCASGRSKYNFVFERHYCVQVSNDGAFRGGGEV